MKNLELKNIIIENLEHLTETELELLNDFLDYKKSKITKYNEDTLEVNSIIENSKEVQILELLSNIKVNTIKELMLHMKWAKFKSTSYGNIYEFSIKDWFRDIFNIEISEAEFIIEYLFETNRLSRTGNENIHPIK